MQDGPGEAAVAALEQESETPERMWTRSMATSTAEELASLSSAARSHQVTPHPASLGLPMHHHGALSKP